jgi:NADH-quinone oxidoreductase subunit J
VVAQRNPLYSAISLIGVFISLACLYVMLAAPFIAAVQVIVYAGAIMVLVVL